MKSQTNPLRTQNTVNNNDIYQTASNISTSNLNAETPAFNKFEPQPQEQLFSELQNINTQLQSLKYQANYVIRPTLTAINHSILQYEANPQLLQLPQHQLSYAQLQQQKNILQQQYLINQHYERDLMQQITLKRELYHQMNIYNQSSVYDVNDDDQSTVDPQQETEAIQPAMAIIPSPNISSVLESASVHNTEYTEYSCTDSEETEIDSSTPICYNVMSLINLQSQFLSIDWSKHKDIPIETRFVSKGVNNEKYMEDIVAMFMRKAENPWIAPSHVGEAPMDKTEILQKKLRGILNKMTPEKFDKIAAQTMNIVNEFAETKEKMKYIIGTILQFAIEIPVFGDQYAKLCKHLYGHLPKLPMVCEFEWVLADNDLSETFRNMIILQTNELYKNHREYIASDNDLDAEELEYKNNKLKRNFFAVIVLIAELYNVELISHTVVYKGVFDTLLPPQNNNLSMVDIEGLCHLFKQCGKKLDEANKYLVNKYLQKVMCHSRKFDFRTKCIVDEIKEMRNNEWKLRIKKEKAKTQQEIRNDFEKEQSHKPKNYRRKNVYNHYQYTDDYDDNGYNIGYNERQRQNDDYRVNYGRNRYHRRYSSGSSQSSEIQQNDNDQEINEGMKQKLISRIDEYMVTGVIDDILNLNCTDFDIWKLVINNGLRDRKSSQIHDFIGLILQLFEYNVLNNKSAKFINIIVKYLAIQLDDSSMDSPNMTRYISQLFTKLCYAEYLRVDPCYKCFTKRYREYSQYQFIAQKKNINTIIRYSIAELQYMKGSQSLISKIDRYSM